MNDIVRLLAKEAAEKRKRIRRANESIAMVGLTLDFEQWAASQFFELGRAENGTYHDTDTLAAFDAWQAAIKALLIALPDMSNEDVHEYVDYLNELRICKDTNRIEEDKRQREAEYQNFCDSRPRSANA